MIQGNAACESPDAGNTSSPTWKRPAQRPSTRTAVERLTGRLRLLAKLCDAIHCTQHVQDLAGPRTCTQSVCVLPGYVRHLFGFRVGPVCQLQIYMRGKESLRSHLRRKVSLCYYCVVAGCLLVASCNVGLRGVGFHRTGRRRAASYHGTTQQIF